MQNKLNPAFYAAYYLHIQYNFTFDFVFLSEEESYDIYCMGSEL